MTAPDPSAAGRSRRRLDVIVFLGATVATSVIGVVVNHLLAARLSSTTLSDFRAFVGALSAVGFLSLGSRLALVGWLGAQRVHERLPSRVVAATLVVAVVAGAAGGVIATSLVSADTRFRVEVGLAFGVASVAILAGVAPMAELMAAERWRRVAALLCIPAVVRTAGVLVPWTTDAPGRSLVPLVVGEVAVAGAAFLLRPASNRHVHASGVFPARRVLIGSLSLAGLLAYLSFSTVAFRSRLGVDAASFNQSAAVAKLVIFAPLMVSLLFFPAMARNRLGSDALRRALRDALVCTCTLATLATAGLFVAPTQLGSLLLADADAIDVAVVRVLALACLATSVSMVAVLLAIAHGSRFALAPWPAAVVVLVGQATASSPAQLANAVLLGSVVLLVTVAIPAVQRVQPVLHPMTVSRGAGIAAPTQGVALVIPNYDAGPALLNTVRAALAHLDELGVPHEVVVVSDGCTDGSDHLLDRAIAAGEVTGVRHVRHPANRGKGAALRTGFAEVRSPLVGFIDADGDLPPSLIGTMLVAQQQTDADVVFGNKFHEGSVVEMSAVRAITSVAYRWMIRVLFRLDIRDTQTGVKLYRTSMITTILPALREEEFALDLEIFIAARAAGFDTFCEVPVTLVREHGSTIRLRTVLRMFDDTCRLLWRSKVALAYSRSVVDDG